MDVIGNRAHVRDDIGNLLHSDVDFAGQRLHGDASPASSPLGCQGDRIHVALLRDLYRPVHV